MSMIDNTIKVIEKAPGERLDFWADYTDELKAYGDSIVASRWVLPSQTVDAPANVALVLSDAVSPTYDDASNPQPAFYQGGTAFNAAKAVVWIDEGGTLGKFYIIDHRGVTTQGRKLHRRFKLLIKEKSGR